LITPIYEGVCRDLRYRPHATRIRVFMQGDFEQMKRKLNYMDLMTKRIEWELSNKKLMDFNPA
jgi:hypothetical protein